MGKSIFEQFANPNTPMGNMFGGFNNFQQNFMNFANQVRQSGQSPEMMVRQLLNSGQMTQEQFNQFSSMANQITGRTNK